MGWWELPVGLNSQEVEIFIFSRKAENIPYYFARNG
jgi:hypothetical protein